MKRLLVSVVAVVVAASLVVAGCGQAAPAPTPTKAPAAPAPTKAPEPTKPAAAATAAPTKAPAPQPTAAPAKKVEYPQKGKTVQVIVPYAAGGGTDVAARVVAAQLEKELGAPFEVVNKPGAGAQVGLTELVKSRPDGYTLGITGLPGSLVPYLDPDRKAVFGRKDFEPVTAYSLLTITMAVEASSPFKSVKDVVDAAKANPEKIKYGTAGLLSPNHLGGLLLEKAAGIKLASVHFDGGAPSITALLGGHIDVSFNGLPEILPHHQAGKARVLGILDKEESKLLPGVKTFEAQGYKVYLGSISGIAGPAGMPKEYVALLSDTTRKVVNSDEFKTKMGQLGYTPYYLTTEQYAKAWADMEIDVKPLVDESKKK